MARKGKMYEKQIESKYLKEKMTLKFYEPEEFNPIYESHVCIMQDGDDYYHLGRIATLSDKFHDDYELVNTVFVGIHYIDRFDRREKYHPHGEQHEDYIKFLVHEVVPLVEEHLPINPLGTSWALMGDSLAGSLAFITAVKYPDLFDKVIMQSPLVDDSMIELAKDADDLSSLEIYHTIGLKETSVPTTVDGRIEFVKPNQALANILTNRLTNYYYHELEDGEHTWKYWQKDLPRALTTMFS